MSGFETSFTVNDANETYGQGTYTIIASQKRNSNSDNYAIANIINSDLSSYSGNGQYLRGWYAHLTNQNSINSNWNNINWIDLENGNATGTVTAATLTIEFPESFQPTKYKIWGNNTGSPTPQILYGYDEANDRYDRIHYSTDTWSSFTVEPYEYNITQTTPKSYKKYAVSTDNNAEDDGNGGNRLEIYPEIRLRGLFEIPLTPNNFVNNILTMENSINANDTDTVDFVLPAGEEIASLNVTNFSGSGTISYTISATGATTITGTVSAIGDNLLANNLLVANAGADITYTLRLTASAAITYTIVGTKNDDIRGGGPAPIIHYTFDTDGTNSGSLGSSYNLNIASDFSITTDAKFNGQKGLLCGPAGAVGETKYHSIMSGTLTTPAAYSFSYWAKGENVTKNSNLRQFVCRKDIYTAPYLLLNIDGANNRLRIYSVNNWGSYGSYTPDLFDANWHHYVITGTSTHEISVYIDNTLVLTHTHSASLTGRDFSNLLIGASENHQPGWGAGYIDDFRMYDFVLSAANVSYIYNNVFSTTVTFNNNILTIENSINQNDTDVVSFVLPAGEEMGSLNVTNFSDSGTISYTISATGATDITGTISAIGDNLLAGNPLITNEGVDITYTLTLTASTAITYRIVGTKTVDYGTPIFEPNWTTLTEQIFGADTTVNDVRFGNTIVKSGNYMISSAPQQDSNLGAAYIFERNASGVWSQVQVLQPASLTSGAKFGAGVAIDGNYLAVGSKDENKAYVYELDNGTWTEKQTLAPTSVSGFGGNASLSGDYLVVGAKTTSNSSGSQGSVHIYKRDGSGTWNEFDVVIPFQGTSGNWSDETSGNPSQNFGVRTKIQGNDLYVGATGTDQVFVFKMNSGNTAFEPQQILSTNTANTDGYGMIDADGDHLIVGAYDGSVESAFIYERDNSGVWGNKVQILDPSPNTSNQFGYSVSISGTRAIVAGYGTSSNEGAAYIYEKQSGSWTKTHDLTPPSGSTGYVGVSTFIDNEYAMVGAYLGDTGGVAGGLVYSYYAPPIIVNGGFVENSLTFTNNILTIENSINQNDTDIVSFILPAGEEMHQLIVSNYVGTGAINYEITTGETTIKSGTISNVGENTAFGTNLLDGNHLTSAVGSTYIVTLNGATAPISYTILGTKVTDYGDSSTPTTLVFTNDVLTINNITSTTDTDVIDFVLPAGYNIPELNVTNFNGTGDVTYTLATGGNTVANGTFSAISSNLLPSGFPLFALSTDITYVLTITSTATISYTIVGTKTITNLSNYSITHFFSSGFTEQQLIDAGIWDADSNANRFNSTYAEGFLDISGNVKVTDNILMDTGDVDLYSHTFTDPYAFTADVPINNRLFVVGDVSMGDASLNIVGDISINGVMTVGTYKPASISLAAIVVDSNPGYSTANSTTTFTEDIVYDKKIQFNGDISLNTSYTPGYYTTFEHVANSVPDTTTTSSNAITLNTSDTKIITSTRQQNVNGGHHARIDNTGRLVGIIGGGSGNYDGIISLSRDYGDNWTNIGNNGIGIAISADGTYLCKVESTTGIHISTDEGVTWTNTYTDFSGITFYSPNPYHNGDSNSAPILYEADVCISGNGKYICVIPAKNTNVLMSNDFGATWSSKFNVGFGYMFNSRMSISGKYICIHDARYAGKIWVSNDSGNTFLENSTTRTGCWGMSMSSSGEYIYLQATKTYAFYSKDFGVTFGSYSHTLRWGDYTGDSRVDGYCHSVWGPNPDIQVLLNMWSPQLFVSVDGGLTYNIGSTQITTAINNTFSGDPNKILGLTISNDGKYLFFHTKSTKIVGRVSINGIGDWVPAVYGNTDATTYFGANTTLKANTGIEFPDGTTLHSSNKESNGTTFKASTFESMTVIGDFASNPIVTSDYRIKNNVETLDEIHTVDNLRPVKYKQTQTGKNDIGFLAHELQEHYPELVEGEKDGDKMQSVNYSGLLPILINEVQQLKKQIAETRARIHSETS